MDKAFCLFVGRYLLLAGRRRVDELNLNTLIFIVKGLNSDVSSEVG